MRHLALAFSALALVACQDQVPVPMGVEPGQDQTLYETPDAAVQAQAIFDPFAAQYPALNVTVMRGDTIVWQAEGGVRRDAQDGVARRYNVYSVAKMVTGMAFARLVQAEGFDLDQSVRTIDPALPDHYDGVTVRQLLSHTAGVRNYSGGADWRAFNDLRCDSPSDGITHFIDDPLVREPGSGFGYTTYGFVLASHLLVTLTGEESFDAALVSVLGETYRGSTDFQDADKAVNWYGQSGRWEAIPLSAECKFGGGGLLVSSQELAAMGADFAAGRVVPVAQMDVLLEPREEEATDGETYVYGMGTGRDPDSGYRFVAHSGGSPGGRSFLLVLVEPQLSIAVTGNFDGPRLDQLAIPLSTVFLD